MSTGRATGIGGVFFKADDPDGLLQWYVRTFGLPSEDGYVALKHSEEPNDALTAFATFERTSDHFGNPSQNFMINFRVDDLDALLTRLEAEGVPIEPKREEYSYGRFAWIADPEGNRVELWEPKP